jgi:hypothetical protein
MFSLFIREISEGLTAAPWHGAGSPDDSRSGLTT